jgi:glyoxylase-like metal-dependent hydrolase (beta-lactamase superfamily II)
MKGFEPGVPVAIGDTNVPVKRILGRNPSAMTGPGTNSYLIGDNRLCLVDPGPRDELQLGSFMEAIGDATLEYILVTHTHGDHSPAAVQLQAKTGAILVGMPAPLPKGHDPSFKPENVWSHDDVIETEEYSVRLIHTPGHVSNHICFFLQEEELLFTGDHVLQGTTSVILPPDGDMKAYLDSLAYLQTLSIRYFAPGHGGLMEDPQAELQQLVAHRFKREKKILDRLMVLGTADLDSLVLSAYDDVAEHLLPWAKKTMLAHLIKLEQEGVVSVNAEVWQASGEGSQA